ncbi:restriction endonuclease subunit S, partial [Sharpea azabuensis]|uniref:restriction endonuclease subunit S n=1 Tax=Sharpea azabuensis TaxID=322505 RepID=UPI002E803B14
RQIKLLEEAAQRLYKEWFVDLRFPGHQSTPIINNLPQSWQKKKLGEIVKTTSGGTPSRGKPEYYTGDILWVKTKELNDSFILDTEEKISIEAINKSSAKILPSGSVLLAMYGATIGKLGIASKKMACNQACCVFLFDDNDVFRWFLYNWLIINRSFLISQGKGAAQPNLSQDMIKNFETIIPDTPLLEKYHRMVAPLYDRIMNNQAQIRNLSEARDRLLPKLMSAEIEV